MSELTGTGALVRLALRRDRVRLPLWTVAAAIFPPLLQAPAIDALYPTTADLVRAARDFDTNATFRMLYGPVPSATVGGVTAWRASFLLVMLGLATALTVIRHTRADEQSGRAELLYATSIGRRAPLAAALLVASGASVVVGAGVAGGMAAMGYGGIGAVAFGLQVATVGDPVRRRGGRRRPTGRRGGPGPIDRRDVPRGLVPRAGVRRRQDRRQPGVARVALPHRLGP